MPNPMNGRRQELARADASLADARLPDSRLPEPRLTEAQPGAGENPVFRLDVRRSLRMHPVLAASVAGAVFVLLVVYALARKPVYTAESLIYVEPLENRVLSDGSSAGYDPSRYDSYLQQQVQTIQREDTLEAAVAKMAPGVWSSPGESQAAAARRLGAALKTPERVLNSYQLSIDVSADNPISAAAAANAITQAYLEEGRKDEHTRADQRLQLLTEERQRIVDDRNRDKAEQASLGASLGVANPNGAAGNPYDMQNDGLRSQLAAAREAHDAVAAQLASVSGTSANGLDTAANELIVADPGLVSIRQTLSQRRAVLSDQMAGLTPANPVYRQDQEEIDALDRSMDRATADARQRAERQLQDKLRLDLRRTADVEGRLNAQLAEQTAKATGAGPKLQRAAELETDLTRLSTRYATVDDAIRGLQLETNGPGQAHLVLAARPPDAPQPSRSKLILLLALPLAALCGIAAAVTARKRDPRLYRADDLQEVLGFAPIGVLPDPGEVSPAAFDEFLLRLAGGLEGAYREGGARSFVITPVSVSASANGLLPQLCAKLQQIGIHARCIDATQLMPGAGRWLGPVAGDAAEAPSPAGGGDAVAATQLERLLQEFDLVLVQAPPLLGSALTEYAVRRADATLLLVESSRTERGDLRRAALLLQRLNPHGVGVVLQKLPLRYADAGFCAAVRAAGHTLLRTQERVVDMPPLAPAVPAVQVEAVEPIDLPAQVGAAPPFEEPPQGIDAALTPAAFVTAMDVKEESEPMTETQGWSTSEDAGAPVEAVPVPVRTDTEPVPEAVEESQPSLAAQAVREEPSRWVAWAEVAPSPAVRHEEAAAPPADARPASSETSEPSAGLRSWAPQHVRATYAAAAEEEQSEPPAETAPLSSSQPVEPEAQTVASEAGPPTPAVAPVEAHETAKAPLRTTLFFSEEAARVSEFQPQSAAVPVETPSLAKEPAVGTPRTLLFAETEAPAQEPLAWATPERKVSEAEVRTEERMSVPAVQSAPASSAEQPAPSIAQPQALKPGKPLGWLRRLLRRDEEPTRRIIADDDAEDDEPDTAVPAMAAAPPEPLAPAVAATPDLEPAPLSTQHDEHSFAAVEEKAESVEASPQAEEEERSFLEPAHPEPALEPCADTAQETEAVVAPELPATLPAPAVAYFESPEPASLQAEVLAETVISDEAGISQGAPRAVHAEPAVTPPAAPPMSSRAPQREVATVAQHEADRAPRTESEAPQPSHFPRTGEHKPELPRVSFARPRTSPVTVTAFPAVATSRAGERRPQDEAREPEPLHRTEPTREHAARPARTPQAGNNVAPQRPGLARALAQATAEEGPPARASESLTEMRKSSGLRRAVAHAQAANLPNVQAPEVLPPRAQPGMSRRWAMLSRFERGDAPEEPARDGAAKELAGAAPRGGPSEPGRNNRV